MMKSYFIKDLTKEFKCPEGFEILALCDEEGGIHISLSRELDEAIKDKSNLYELICEHIEAGLYKEIESFKCYVITKEMLKAFQERKGANLE